MAYGIRKGLEDVAHELKGIRNILASLWAQKETDEGTATSNPEMYADEYITTEECARRLSVSDQTIRNWIATGRSKTKKNGWIEGVHYVNINPGVGIKGTIRIPWNHLVRSFIKNPNFKTEDYKRRAPGAYKPKWDSIDVYLKDLEKDQDVPNDTESDGSSL